MLIWKQKGKLKQGHYEKIKKTLFLEFVTGVKIENFKNSVRPEEGCEFDSRRRNTNIGATVDYLQNIDHSVGLTLVLYFNIGSWFI